MEVEKTSDRSPIAVAVLCPPNTMSGAVHPCSLPRSSMNMLHVHSINTPLFWKVAQILHCLAHFRFRKKAHTNKENCGNPSSSQRTLCQAFHSSSSAPRLHSLTEDLFLGRICGYACSLGCGFKR